MNDQTWRQQAACLGHEQPDLWFPNTGDDNTRAEAKAICRACNVTSECQAEAIRTRSEGIWGGKTIYRPSSRPEAIEPNDTRCGTPAGYTAHRRRLEPACQPCRDAQTADSAARDRRSDRDKNAGKRA